MRINGLLAATAMVAALGVASAASAAVIEDFETGGFGAAWVNSGGIPVNGGGAHDGNFGVSDGGAVWTYRTDVTVGNSDTLSAWFRSGDGRDYLGFGADGNGASSFVLAGNSNDIRFQNNDSYGFAELNTQGFSFNFGQWYLATVTLGGGNVTGRLYDSDGTTLLASLVASGLDHGAGGGVAIRSFGGSSYDTIGLSSGAPEPAAWTLMIVGVGMAGTALRRRRQAVAA